MSEHWIQKAVDVIMGDLDDRKGLTDGIDDAVRDDIRNTIKRIITRTAVEHRVLPDVFVTVEPGVIKAYSNNPSEVGRVLTWHNEKDETNSTIITEVPVSRLKGGVRDWMGEISTGMMDGTMCADGTQFLKDFIKRNS